MTPKLFSSLRTDPNKTQDGVWFTNSESGDMLKIRPLMCAQQIKAYIEALDDYATKHGEDERESEGAEKHAEALSTAMGQITDWKLSSDPEVPYDAAQMCAALIDPELEDLRVWIRTCSLRKGLFRPEAAAEKSEPISDGGE
jgi:hypothetical protein